MADVLFFICVVILCIAAAALWTGHPIVSLLASFPAVLGIIIVMLIDIGQH